MTSSASSGPTITTERAWSKLMRQMGGTNMQRARDARKAANALQRYLAKH